MLARNSAVAVFSSLAIIGIGYSIAIYRKGSSLLKETKDQVQKAYLQLIGHTSLIELPELSRLTGCRIFVKMECMNPGGTGKDRAAKYMLQEAMKEYNKNHHNINSNSQISSQKSSEKIGNSVIKGILDKEVMKEYNKNHHNNSNSQISSQKSPENIVSSVIKGILDKETDVSPLPVIFEGTSGSTGIALACLCNAMGLKLHVVMPDDQADEKQVLLKTLGVTVTVVPCSGISNKDHYVNTARRMAQESGGIFIDQFENLANYQAHYEETGPEIWDQTRGKVDAFVMSAGTGGTIAGVSRFLKGKKPSVQIVLADPTGSSLFQRVKYGVCYTNQQSEKKIKKHRYDSIVEGVGLDRVTANFQLALIDDAEKVSDQEILDTAHWLLREEGLFVGSSSAMNVAAACRLAKKMPANSVIVTVICDNGQRHLSRFWNPVYIEKYGLSWPMSDIIPEYLK